MRSRLRGVRLELIQARQVIANLRSKQSLGSAAEVTRALNQVATLQKELANSNAAVSRAEGAVEKLALLARRENAAKQQAEEKAGLAAMERDEAVARASGRGCRRATAGGGGFCAGFVLRWHAAGARPRPRLWRPRHRRRQQLFKRQT